MSALLRFAIALAVGAMAGHAAAKKDKDKVEATLTAPASGALYTAPATIGLTATATAKQKNHPVVLVEFFAGATLIGSVAGPIAGNSYSLSWTGVAAGAYSLTARATNDKGDTDTSDPVAIIVNARPTVNITSPASGTVVQSPGTVALSATAADPDGTIAKVEFHRDGVLVAADTAAPFEATVAGLAAGIYSFTAIATDNHNATAASAAVAVRVNAAPSVSITSPASGTIFNAPGLFILSASASDADGTVAKVQFLRDGVLIATDTTAPYEAIVAGLASGTYSFTAIATDNDGRETAGAAVGITVNAVPSISITSPAGGATFNAPASITISANASDQDGAVNRVEFFANGALIGMATSAPFDFAWNNVATGTYALTAKALDNNNSETLSATVSITVRVASTLYFVHSDHLNTSREIYNQSQQLVWRRPHQEPFSDSPPDENPSGLGVFEYPLRESNYYADKETNLHYNYFRDYDPSIGRYAESDPIGLRGGINTYVYVAASPLLGTDPLGLAQFCCRDLDSFVLGTVLGRRHCYVVADDSTVYGLYPENVGGRTTGVPRTNDPRDRGGDCLNCPKLECESPRVSRRVPCVSHATMA